MTRSVLAVSLLAGAAWLAACSSEPTRFYTLSPLAAGGAPAPGAAPFLIDVQDVTVPQQVDMPQLVLRQSDGEVAVVESRQWIAPLPEEIRDAVSRNLSRRLDAIDVHSQAAPRKVPIYHVRLDVTRFESVPAHEARLEASWTVGTSRTEGPLLHCSSALSRPAEGSVDSLVAAHQAALDALSAQVAAAISAAAAGRAASCPGP